MMLAASPWALGWEAIAALATGVLAFFTYALARSSVRLAGETAEEIEAAWQPLIIPLVGEPAQIENGWFRFKVKNEGRGPALDLLFALRHEDRQIGGFHQAPILSPGAEWTPELWLEREPDDLGKLFIEYANIAEKRFTTEVVYLRDFEARGPAGAPVFKVQTVRYRPPAREPKRRLTLPLAAPSIPWWLTGQRWRD